MTKCLGNIWFHIWKRKLIALIIIHTFYLLHYNKMYKAPLETPKNQRIPEKIAIYIIQDSSSEGINSPLQIYIKKIIKNNTQNIQRRFYVWRLTQSCFEEIQEKDTIWFRHLVTNGKHIATYSIHVYGFSLNHFSSTFEVKYMYIYCMHCIP